MFQLITELLAYAGIPFLCATVIAIIWRLSVLHDRELDQTWDSAYELGWYAGAEGKNPPQEVIAEAMDRGEFVKSGYNVNATLGPVDENPAHPTVYSWEPAGESLMWQNKYGTDPDLCYDSQCPFLTTGLPCPHLREMHNSPQLQEAIRPDPIRYRYPPEYQDTGNVVTLRGPLPILERSPELPEPVHVHPREDPPFSTSQYAELAPKSGSGPSGDVTSQDTWLQDREASVVMWRIREEEKSRNWRNREARVIARTERDWWAAS